MTVFANDTQNNKNNTQKVYFTVDRTSSNVTINYNFADNRTASVQATKHSMLVSLII